MPWGAVDMRARAFAIRTRGNFDPDQPMRRAPAPEFVFVDIIVPMGVH